MHQNVEMTLGCYVFVLQHGITFQGDSGAQQERYQFWTVQPAEEAGCTIEYLPMHLVSC